MAGDKSALPLSAKIECPVMEVLFQLPGTGGEVMKRKR
jgi:hypothetical protein